MYGLLCNKWIKEIRNKQNPMQYQKTIWTANLPSGMSFCLSHLFFDEESYYVAQVIILDPPDFALHSWNYRHMLPGLASNLSSWSLCPSSSLPLGVYCDTDFMWQESPLTAVTESCWWVLFQPMDRSWLLSSKKAFLESWGVLPCSEGWTKVTYRKPTENSYEVALPNLLGGTVPIVTE